MRFGLAILFALLIGTTAHAQLSFLSDNRSVSASGTVQDFSGNVLGGYAQTNYPSSPFADFNSQASGGFGGASSTATQNSTLSPNFISSGGETSASTFTGIYGDGYEARAQAGSAFEVSFSIQQPVAYNLSGSAIVNYGGSIDLELSSLNHGNILSWMEPQVNNSVNESGMLQPDTYTLEVQEYSSFFEQGNNYDEGGISYNMVFSVPEPALIGPFLALIWFGTAIVRKKLAKV